MSFIQLITGSTHSFLDWGPVGVLSGKSTVLGTETIIPLVTQDRFKEQVWNQHFMLHFWCICLSQNWWLMILMVLWYLDNPFVIIGSFLQQILLLCLLSVRHLDGSSGYLELMSTGESDYRHIHTHISIHECVYLKPTSRWVLWRKLTGGCGGTGGWDGIGCVKEDVINSTGWSQVLKWGLLHLYSPFAQPSNEHTEDI